MEIATFTAEHIAQHQLLSAIQLWHSADYLSALTLAGAADEILGKRLRKLGLESSFDQLKSLVVTLARSAGETDPNIDKLVGELLNDTRNALKHYAGDEAIEIDIRDDCTEMLERAISNYHQLTGAMLDEAISFWAEAHCPK
ncbi:hypothetical protein O4H66_00565 [Comamonadaceae bacterium G21597-S1]|nr:hypothetical protein [Comamonadaceae bacterium G21597-S1]